MRAAELRPSAAPGALVALLFAAVASAGPASAPATVAPATPATAAPPTAEAPLNISADHGDIDRRAGTARYWGNVTITRGSTRITADDVVLALTDGELTKATITGSPATFAQSFGEGRAPTLGSARILTFTADQDVIELREGARVVQDGDEVSGELIRYDSAQQRVLAAGGDQSGRVQMTITPRKPKPPADGAPPEKR
jgi:lipopolysaccharide export system protein LptA